MWGYGGRGYDHQYGYDHRYGIEDSFGNEWSGWDKHIDKKSKGKKGKQANGYDSIKSMTRIEHLINEPLALLSKSPAFPTVIPEVDKLDCGVAFVMEKDRRPTSWRELEDYYKDNFIPKMGGVS
jgi:hypothetical protein